jgi:heme/copper-type cytochrome/quinol oxidase subunit 2
LNENDDEVSEDTLKNKNFESYLRSMENIKPGNLRLLEVDNRIILPVNTHIRLIVSSADVIHS